MIVAASRTLKNAELPDSAGPLPDSAASAYGRAAGFLVSPYQLQDHMAPMDNSATLSSWIFPANKLTVRSTPDHKNKIINKNGGRATSLGLTWVGCQAQSAAQKHPRPKSQHQSILPQMQPHGVFLVGGRNALGSPLFASSLPSNGRHNHAELHGC